MYPVRVITVIQNEQNELKFHHNFARENRAPIKCLFSEESYQNKVTHIQYTPLAVQLFQEHSIIPLKA